MKYNEIFNSTIDYTILYSRLSRKSYLIGLKSHFTTNYNLFFKNNPYIIGPPIGSQRDSNEPKRGPIVGSKWAHIGANWLLIGAAWPFICRNMHRQGFH